MRKIKVIDVGGVARAGKDTFVSILLRLLNENGHKAGKVALADPLKGYADRFLQENLGISAYTQVPEEKLLIRPMLVWFGDAKRKQTNGRFWVDLATKRIDEMDAAGYDYAVVSDVRYDHYERDELYWGKVEMNGILVHVSRYTEETVKTSKVSKSQTVKVFVPPANDHEMINDPKIKRAADHIIEWPTLDCSARQLETHPEMVRYVREFMERFSIS